MSDAEVIVAENDEIRSEIEEEERKYEDDLEESGRRSYSIDSEEVVDEVRPVSRKKEEEQERDQDQEEEKKEQKVEEKEEEGGKEKEEEANKKEEERLEEVKEGRSKDEKDEDHREKPEGSVETRETLESARSFDTTCLPTSKSLDRVATVDTPVSFLAKDYEPREAKTETRVGVVGESLPIGNNSGDNSSTSTTGTGTGTGIGSTAATGKAATTTDQGSNEKQAVGEWNSLPILVERLRTVLELSLAIADTSSPIKEDSRLDLEDERGISKLGSMDERATSTSNGKSTGHGNNNNAKEEDLKNELRFLEDLLMSDIHTALSRLRETLERIDVAALAKHGVASDPTSKLQLLRLVSSLLSRLEVPREKKEEEEAEAVAEEGEETAKTEAKTEEARKRSEGKKLPSETTLAKEEKLKSSATTTPTASRRRRASRHTIGVSAEELACARKWLQEERNFKEVRPLTKIVTSPYFPTTPIGDTNAEKVRNGEEIHDKYTKDAINHRQSLRDKNIEKSIEKKLEMRTRAGPFYDDRQDFGLPSQSTIVPADTNPITRSTNLETARNKLNVDNENEGTSSIEVGRVGRLAAALQQRATAAESTNKCSSSNRFIAKKSKIKRANTIDIPSYLKLQADNLKQEGCVSLKKPINVGDKTNPNSANAMIIPSFQPKTENDRKFMALINKNNEAPVYNVPTSFKPFGYVKNTDSSSVSHENWNSRFSNIKTAFDKTKTFGEDPDQQQVGRVKIPKRPPVVPQLAQRYNPAKEKSFDANLRSNRDPNPSNASQSVSPGFRHAPSSPFRRIEKPPALSNFVKPSPVTCEPPRSNIPVPGNTLREKARMMFDRGAGNVQQRATEYKVQVDGNTEKRGFPRPPWIEHEKPSSNAANAAIAENGRLDYRSFCKQFAPFVSKGATFETQDFSEAHRQREIKPYPNVVDGKISFKMIPKDYDRYNVEDSREVETNGSRRADVTLRGSASVAVQTGTQDDNYDEARSFRVAPRISNGPPSTFSNASIQTSNDLQANEDLENAGYYKLPSIIPENVRRFVPDNQETEERINEYRSRNESDSVRDTCSVKENVRESLPFYEHRPETIATSNRAQTQHERDQPFVEAYEPVSRAEQSEYASSKRNFTEDDRYPPDYDFLDAKNIENQDITEEDGVITRYTCAIATVATIESPEILSEVTLEVPSTERDDPREYSTPSVSPVDEEIRRHNMLQQSLIQRLRHERCTMADQGPYDRPQNFQNGIQGNVAKERAYERASYVVAPRPNEYTPIESYKKEERSISPSLPSNRSKRVVELPQAKKFLAPDTPATWQSQQLTTGSSRVVNQVSALREVYEQPAVGQVKPMRKERSPVPNGTNPIDSSDEYLMSCASQPSRSIVLSKSESWHQLALSNSCTRIPSRISNESGPSSSKASVSCLPKPPKPRSPSSTKLRTKQFEASSDSVRKMEDKIRRYFDSPNETSTNDNTTTKKRSSPRHVHSKCMIGLSRSRTLPGICDQKLVLTIPPLQVPLLQVNSADVDKVFDDIFQEATRMDGQHC